jgi:hypothetical protein
MRKIDAEAYNKRLHTEIMELDKMINSINPENVNQIDANLIKTADTYIQLISDATWDANSNFNGIEMHKVRDMLGKLKVSRNKLYVGREIVYSEKEGENTYRLNHTINAPKNFDARNSIVIPRYADKNTEGKTFHKKIEESMSLFHETKFVVYKQQTKIIIDFELNVSEDFSDKIAMTFLYIFWR